MGISLVVDLIQPRRVGHLQAKIGKTIVAGSTIEINARNLGLSVTGITTAIIVADGTTVSTTVVKGLRRLDRGTMTLQSINMVRVIKRSSGSVQICWTDDMPDGFH